MTPVLTFFIGLAILVLFGWYFASRRRSVTPHSGDCPDHRGHGVLPLVDLSAFRREADRMGQ